MSGSEELEQIQQKIRRFRDDREWKQFHDHKSLAASIVIEASELLEHFQWKSIKEAEEYVVKHKEEVGEEIADVLIYLLELSDIMELDVLEAMRTKLEKNAIKYPVEKSRGNSRKYTQL